MAITHNFEEELLKLYRLVDTNSTKANRVTVVQNICKSRTSVEDNISTIKKQFNEALGVVGAKNYYI